MITKVYADRACHFAHAADPANPTTCRRTAPGTSSADHLYIKHGILRWLAGQDVAATALVPHDADGPRTGEVQFEPHGHGCLRVLHGHPRTAAPQPATGATQLILGEGLPADPQDLVRRGYVHRIRCVPDGTARRIQFGIEHHGGTDWFELSECEPADWGLATPMVHEVRRLRSTRRPLGPLPRHPDTDVRATVIDALPRAAEQPSDDRAEALEALRHALATHVGLTQLMRCRDRAEAVTRDGATADENPLLRTADDAVLRLQRAVGISTFGSTAPRPLTRAERNSRKAFDELLNRLRNNGHAEPVAFRRLVSELAVHARIADRCVTPDECDEVHGWQRWAAQARRAAAPKRPKKAVPDRLVVRPKSAVRPPARTTDGNTDGIEDVADAVRDVLEHAARGRRTVRWTDLCAQAKGLAELPADQQCRLLAMPRPRGSHPPPPRRARRPGHRRRRHRAPALPAGRGPPRLPPPRYPRHRPAGLDRRRECRAPHLPRSRLRLAERVLRASPRRMRRAGGPDSMDGSEHCRSKATAKVFFVQPCKREWDRGRSGAGRPSGRRGTDNRDDVTLRPRRPGQATRSVAPDPSAKAPRHGRVHHRRERLAPGSRSRRNSGSRTARRNHLVAVAVEAVAGRSLPGDDVQRGGNGGEGIVGQRGRVLRAVAAAP